MWSGKHPVAVAGARGLLSLALGVILWLATSPAPPETASLGWDKLNHAAAFAVLAMLAMPACGAMPVRRAARLTLAGLLAYGVLIEVVQAFLPTRSAELADLVADAAGLAVGLVVWSGIGTALAAPGVGAARRP